MIAAFLQSLAGLLPRGFAWPRDENSVLMRTLRGWAASLAELHEFMRLTVLQWQPLTAVTRLSEWERATGLPDECFGASQTEQLRRKLLLAKLRGFVGAYEDSSPQAVGAIQDICASLGYSATVVYNTPFRVGLHRVGQRLGALDGRLYITVALQSQRFRVGANRVGERLLQGTSNGGELACYLGHIVAARFQVIVNFV